MKTKYILLILLIVPMLVWGQQRPNRFGTTAADFLEIGYGSAGVAMGEAYVTMASDVSAMYWNPAGLAFMKQSEAQFTIQPWVVDINSSFVGTALVVPGVGTLGAGLIYMDYGDMDVTTVDFQEGTGEVFSSSSYAFNLSFARKLTNWFAFGASGKFVGFDIWHMSASALAVDLGVTLNTFFFSPTGERGDGMRIAMSISNYGTRMRFEGLDLLTKIDPLPNEDGNFGDVQGQYLPQEWELPLIFRLGFAVNAIKTDQNRFTFALDALHPNNNAESVNLGGEYEFHAPTMGKFFLRGGYKGLFLPDDRSEFGLTLGGGFQKYLMGNLAIKFDYAFRDVGLLGDVHSYGLGIMF